MSRDDRMNRNGCEVRLQFVPRKAELRGVRSSCDM